jgi:DNA-binding transcriptional LysR family regulator
VGNLSDIAVFVRIVERGSFTAAAADLEMSKAAVSKYLSRLESSLGGRLLNRTTRRLTLTEAGEALYRGASRALADLEAAEADVLELAGHPRGRLRATVPVLFATEFLAPRLCEFINAYPDIVLDLDLDNRLVDLVADRFDVGIRMTTLTDSSLVARRLAEVRVVTVAAPQYLGRRGTPKTPPDLRDHECFVYNLDRAPNEWQYRGEHGGTETVRVKGHFRCNSDQMLKRAALDGRGMLRMPELFIRDELRAGQLVEVLQDYTLPPVTLAAVFPTRENLAPKVRVFVDFLAKRFNGQRGAPACE